MIVNPLHCVCKQCDWNQVFKCDICKRLMPYCMGAADDMPDSCTYCWNEAHGIGIAPPVEGGVA